VVRRFGRRLRFLPVALIAAALLVVPQTGATAAPQERFTLSSEVDAMSMRTCLPEELRIGITNTGGRAGFADISVSAEPPLVSSKTGISTYVPAGTTVEVWIELTAAPDADNGTYEVVFATGRRERLAIPVTVANPPGARCIPRERMTATATSSQLIPDHHPRNAIDGSRTTMWHTRWNPVKDPLPQSITLDLGGIYDVAELVYVPRITGGRNGIVTAYTLDGSVDGETFTELAQGTWADDTALKSAELDAPGVRFLRMEVREGYGGYASAAEIVLFGRES